MCVNVDPAVWTRGWKHFWIYDSGASPFQWSHCDLKGVSYCWLKSLCLTNRATQLGLDIHIEVNGSYVGAAAAIAFLSETLGAIVSFFNTPEVYVNLLIQKKKGKTEVIKLELNWEFHLKVILKERHLETNTRRDFTCGSAIQNDGFEIKPPFYIS